jgi:hypothetical protein
MTALQVYPGTTQHRSMLRAIVAHYENDPRILAVSVFGSLGRGNWDRYSDIDLDVVVADGVPVNVDDEMIGLSASFASVQQAVAFVIPRGDDACDIVFKSLFELSVRYHPLATTSPNIVDSLQLLWGRVDRKAIESAGLGNAKPDGEPMGRILDRCIRHAIEVDSALHRNTLWAAVELLHLMREAVMELYAYSHHGGRSCQFFQERADGTLQARLGAALPQYDLQSAKAALDRILDFLAHDLEQLTDGQVHLSEAHREILSGIRERQEVL